MKHKSSSIIVVLQKSLVIHSFNIHSKLNSIVRSKFQFKFAFIIFHGLLFPKYVYKAS
jgi:low affinity Fe/Cu permease